MIFLTAVQATAALNDGLKPALQALAHNLMFAFIPIFVVLTRIIMIDSCF